MFNLAKCFFRKPPWLQLHFPTTGFQMVVDNVILEEQQLDEFKRGVYYPVNIGDVYAARYQVVGELGFGVTSTAWLARDLK
jgi:serine/threonine-protein kinase SRPK3